MKTKLLLATICLPALFAACTADEFVDQQQVNLNRETINLTLINSGLNFGNPETRMGATEGDGGSLTYKWIDTDKLGAAVLDGKEQGTMDADNKAHFNYAFNRTSNETEGSKFTAASPVMKGNYLFYHQYTGSVDRDVVKLSVEAEQIFNPDLATSAADQMALYVKGVSPVVDLTATGIKQEAAENLQLPVKFANVGVPVKFVIKANNLPESGAKLERIVITKVAGGNITLGGAINFNKLYASGANKVAVTENSTPEELEAAFDEKRADIIDIVNDGTIFVSSGKVENSSVSVTVKGNDNAGEALSEEEGKVVYLVMPNNSTSTNYTVKIQTSEGYYEKNDNFVFASTGGTTSVEGAGVRTLKVSLDFNNNTGNIKQPTTFNIPQDYTWAAALKYINSHPKLYLTQEVEFKLTGDAEITSEEEDYSAFQDLNINLTSDGHKLTVGSGIIGSVNSKRWKFVDAATIIVPEDKELTIQSLGTLNAAVTIENNGTLALNGISDATNLKITNNNVLKLNAATEVHTLTNAGTVLTNEFSLTVANTLVNAGENAAITVAKGGTLALTAATMTNAATITNNGTLELGVSGAAATTLTNTGVITNAGKIKSISSSASSIANSGAAAVIELEKGGVSDGASTTEYSATTGNGKIIIKDIADYSAIVTAEEYNIAAGSTVTTRVTDVEEYTTAIGVSAINNITLAAGTTWRFADSASGEVLAVPATQGITTEANVNVLLANGLTATQTFASLTVEGANTVLKAVNNIGQPNETEESASAAVTITALTISAAGNLTVNESVTVNAAASSNNQTADIQGVLTVAGKLYFSEATIGSATNSNAELNLTPKTNGGTAAEFGVKDDFNNYGTVTATKSGDQVRGKVTRASNKDNGKIIGEWDDTIIFS